MYKKRYYIFIVIALFAFTTLLSSSLRATISRPVRVIAGGIDGPVSNLGRKTNSFFSIFRQISSLRSKNKELGEKIISLEVDRNKIGELERENGLLKKELGFVEEHKEQDLVPAKIVEREPTTFLDDVVVDRGSKDGIKSKMAVISGGVLIGQTSDVYDKQTKIVLITSKDSMVQAMMQNSRAKGILRGGISGLYLENVPQDTDFSQGEYVVTSGLGGNIKQGILIGKARESKSYFSGIFKNIFVEPIADLSGLEIVFIVK